MTPRTALGIAALSLSALATPAHAAKVPLFFGYGDELFEVTEFPAEIIKQNPNASTLKVGYKCSHFSLLWADVWTWDCTMVGVAGEKSYTDLPSEITTQLAGNPQYAMGKAQRSFWNHYPKNSSYPVAKPPGGQPGSTLWPVILSPI
jgi:hypothetical protein